MKAVQLFRGLHRLLVMVATLAAILLFGVVWLSDYEPAKRQLDSLRQFSYANEGETPESSRSDSENVETRIVRVEIAGETTNHVFPSDVSEDEVRQAVHEFVWSHPQVLKQEERVSGALWSLAWQPAAAGSAIYLLGLAMLLAGRWVVRGFAKD